MIARLLLTLLLLVGGAQPAAAQGDDIAAAARSVVRVVVIATEDGEVVDFGHGSGFAVGPRRIVTNAHVVALAAQYPESVVIGIVPWQGAQPQRARLVTLDPNRDLALLEMESGSLPPVSLYTGRMPEGGPVAALGYPGNVDLATAQSWQDYVRPAPPTRSSGNFSNLRTISGVSTLLHTAAIARGNSGGPLLDQCGRVLGVNTLITRNDEGDAPFFFALANTEVAAFLRAAGQPFNAVSGTCISMADRLRADQERALAEARAREDAEEARLRARDQALEQARIAVTESRENRLGVAALLLALSLLAFGTAGVLVVRNQLRPAPWAAGLGALLLIAAVWVFFTRPSLADVVAGGEETKAAAGAALAASNICRLVPERSRVTVSATQDVELDWTDGGCVNGRTQYAQTGDRWTRILVPNEEQTISVLEVLPAAREYTVTRYLLDAPIMARARRLRAAVDLKACTPDDEARTQLAEQQRQIADILPNVPNERLVYACERAP